MALKTLVVVCISPESLKLSAGRIDYPPVVLAEENETQKVYAFVQKIEKPESERYWDVTLKVATYVHSGEKPQATDQIVVMKYDETRQEGTLEIEV